MELGGIPLSRPCQEEETAKLGFRIGIVSGDGFIFMAVLYLQMSFGDSNVSKIFRGKIICLTYCTPQPPLSAVHIHMDTRPQNKQI